VNSLLAGLGIVLFLSVVMGSYRNLFLANLPLRWSVGVLAGLLTGGNLSLRSLVGFVTLSVVEARIIFFCE
jgi:Cu/Ag efflux pump CusA